MPENHLGYPSDLGRGGVRICHKSASIWKPGTHLAAHCSPQKQLQSRDGIPVLPDFTKMNLSPEQRLVMLEAKVKAIEGVVGDHTQDIAAVEKKQEKHAEILAGLGGSGGGGVKVSFTAALRCSGAVTIGPSKEKIAVTYENVITNVGGAYNPETGIFTAPVKGVYFFTVTAFGEGHGHVGTGVCLHRNDEHTVVAWSRQPDQKVSTTNSASLLLENSDNVCVKLWPNSWLFDNDSNLSTFSGHLLFPM
ncbi:hypothetical protein ACEWY4_021312 [Coilia grayii]|uniref:C1q domain-containing protein n=1 Tax=Coilia grayii TaxID=363190 RepID=A0ABD1J8P8_9TELE